MPTRRLIPIKSLRFTPTPIIENPTEVRIHRLQVIFKVAERCNLACTYCYYFFGDDQSYADRPAVMSLDTVRKAAAFLRQGADEIGLNIVQVVFHGGEPMLMKKRIFDQACTILRSAFDGAKAQLQIGIQTNGTLVTDEWIDIFARHGVYAGVSIDGPAQYNDIARVDHKGRGSHERVVEGTKKLVRRCNSDAPTLNVGSLTVMDPNWDYREVVRHFVEDLGLQRLGFLLPDYSQDSMKLSGEEVRKLGQALCDIADEWAARPDLTVREVEKVLAFFQVAIPSAEEIPQGVWFQSNEIIDIQSDGTILADDSLIPTQALRDRLATGHVEQITLKQFLGQSYFEEYRRASVTLPTACRTCAWKRLCRGGDMENRFSVKNGFDNASIYCEALKMFYERIVRHMVAAGYPSSRIAMALGLDTDVEDEESLELAAAE